MGRLLPRSILAVLLSVSAIQAADLTGIWTGQVKGRNNEKEDISFQFTMKGDKLTGTLFGDEFDVPIEDGTVNGDQVRFVVTTKNYYNGTEVKFEVTGTITGNQIELKRSRIGGPPPNPNDTNRRPTTQTFTIQRLT